MRYYLGVDVGSISAKAVVIDTDSTVVAYCYKRTQGNPVTAIKEVLSDVQSKIPGEATIHACGTTGSARMLAGAMVGADVVKNEILAHAVAVGHLHPEAKSVIEIGGQDSKLILLQNSVPVDFAMNTVCAAGTGSFLDHQAIRLGVPIEQFGDLALKSKNSIHIASRCTVFAESDMIHKTQLGVERNDIIGGLCNAIARNYLNTVAKGKNLNPKVLFQGGVAANTGVKKAFERALGVELIVPEHFLVMGALGAALLASRSKKQQSFIGFSNCIDQKFESRGFECEDCPNLCEIVEACREEKVVARYGSRCGKWG
ncbi:acyl-CoA dehydratase activase [Chitinispirillales bacterium ANBcel5]|uniref:acyl-CoA dehydratase activase n=1 Tax=Cellulosispirillum alkaliphilum TaxID=3039283 RepID=UPI002A5301C1|nr:acyl-CoA dehydratase activase [Chitinispirillales bacterium ANBcel5]